MAIARRLYLYVITGAALASWASGAVGLLQVFVVALWDLLSRPAVVSDPEALRRQVSLNVALLLVGFPIWAVHWWLIQRGLAEEDERRSAIRALFLALVLLGTFGVWVPSASEVVRVFVLWVSGVGEAPDAGPRRLLEEVATFIPVYAIWLAHARMARDEHRSLPLHGPADWIPRLYAYAAAAIGLTLLVVGTANLLQTGLDAVFGWHVVLGTLHWPMATWTSLVAIGLLVWALHWGESLRLVASADAVAERERRASLRWLYLGFVVFASLVGLLVAAAAFLQTVLRWVLGVAGGTGIDVLHALLDAVAWAVPTAVVLWYHRSAMQREAELLAGHPRVGPDWATGVTRTLRYLAAFAGLAFTVFGVGALVGFLLRLLVVAVTGETVGAWREELAFVLAVALVSGGAWLWFWREILVYTAREPAREAAALSRRVYLYGALGASVLVLLGSAGVVLYQVVAWLLGVMPGVSALLSAAPALGFALVALAVLTFHLRVLLQDARVAEKRPAVRTVRLVLKLPLDVDEERVVRDLADHLPPGAVLERST